MDTAKILNIGKSQAILLPKAYSLKGKETYITKIGDTIILLPKLEKWELMFASLEKFSDDFMAERNQPSISCEHKLFS